MVATPETSGPIFKCGVGACTPLFHKTPSLRRFKKTPEGEGARRNAFALSNFVSRKTNAIANAWDEGVRFICIVPPLRRGVF